MGELVLNQLLSELQPSMILRATALLTPNSSAANLARVTGISLDKTTEILSKLEHCGALLSAFDHNSAQYWRVSDTVQSEVLEQVDARVTQAFTLARIAAAPKDISGRLEWIEDLYTLIQIAKKSRDEAFLSS